MSCMIATDKHLNVVVNVIASRSVGLWCDHLLARAEDLDKLGAALADLNAKAFNLRYRHDVKPARPVPFRYSPLALVEPITACKALRFLHHQLCEGEIADHPMTMALDDLSDDIARTIICCLPEYQQAPWGIE